jgi:Arc/MetJ-type ribon-helix-helix transcriptional regulator
MDKEGTPKEDWRITLRLPRRDYYFVQRLVEEGEYVNAAEVLRNAVKRFRAELELNAPVRSKGVKALWIFKEEIDQKDVGDWFAAHTSFMLPIHSYRGEVHLFNDALVFYGTHAKTSETKVAAVPFRDIRSVYMGFDEAYKRRETRGGFNHEAPLRIEYKQGSAVKGIYVFMEFNRITRSNKNQEWLETLQRIQRAGN